MRRSLVLCLIAGAALVGLTLGRVLPAPWWLTLLSIPLLLLRRPAPVLIMLALTLGLWRGGEWTVARSQYAALIGVPITVQGTVADDPAVTAAGLNFNLTNVRLDGRAAPGQLPVHDYHTHFTRGDQLTLSGKLKPGFGNAPAELGFPKILSITHHQDWLERLRGRFFAGMRTALPEPAASFGLGLLVGIRALIPKPLQSELAAVGLSHLVAVSGYNLTIIVAAAHRLLRRAGRGIALAGSLWLIAGFLAVTGATPSIVRAALVSVLALLAAFYGRKFQPLVLILLTAAVTAAVNPAYLTDLGWLLSYLAFFGILVLAPAIENRIGKPKSFVVRMAVESLCAQLLTFPLIALMFGQLSVAGPLTNFLILPLVPIAMLTALIAGLGGMLVPAFSGLAAWPAALVLGLMLAVINTFAAQGWAVKALQITLPQMLIMYALMIVITLTVWSRQRDSPKSKVAVQQS